MKNVKWPLAVVAVAISVSFLFGQQELCGTMTNIEAKMKADSAYALRYANFLTFMRNQQNNDVERSTDSSYPAIYIPVVFHVIYYDSTGPENITDAQVLSQIAALNRDYNYQPGQEMPYIPDAYKSLVANANIHFCMAQFDPNGDVTTGIDRRYFDIPSWNTQSEIDSLLKPATIWDNTLYLNIWSVIMGGALESSGWLAYSSLPPDVFTANTDGIAARYDVIGTTGNLLAGIDEGKTVSHEVGHWLGLFHTFQDGCTGGDSCTLGGDYICDTPPEAAADYGCPTFPNITCSNGPNGDLFMDFMDYSSDACRGMFTPDQVQRMHATLSTYRPHMLQASNGCFYQLDAALNGFIIPATSNCSLSFTPTVLLQNKSVQNLTSGDITYKIDGNTAQTMNWTGSMTTGQVTQFTLPAQTVTAGAHTLLVIFNNADGLGPDYNTANDTLSLTFNAYSGSTAMSLPFTDGFEQSTFPDNGWSLYNPNNDTLNFWKLNTSVGAYGQSSKCIWMDDLAYRYNPRGISEGVISPEYDFTTMQYPQLSFDVAYAAYNSSRIDSMKIFYSLDCGSTWQPLWQESGFELSTAPAQTGLFQPADSQWTTVQIPLVNLIGLNQTPLLSLTGYQKVSFMFVNLSGAGNAMYLDNIGIQNNATLSVPVVTPATVDVKIYPNPASNMVAVRLPSGNIFNKLQLVNELGQVVYESGIQSTALIFSTQNLSSGMYLVHLTGTGINQTEKLIIAR